MSLARSTVKPSDYVIVTQNRMQNIKIILRLLYPLGKPQQSEVLKEYKSQIQ
jgi:hypothetical protein